MRLAPRTKKPGGATEISFHGRTAFSGGRHGPPADRALKRHPKAPGLHLREGRTNRPLSGLASEPEPPSRGAAPRGADHRWLPVPRSGGSGRTEAAEAIHRAEPTVVGAGAAQHHPPGLHARVSRPRAEAVEGPPRSSRHIIRTVSWRLPYPTLHLRPRAEIPARDRALPRLVAGTGEGSCPPHEAENRSHRQSGGKPSHRARRREPVTGATVIEPGP